MNAEYGVCTICQWWKFESGVNILMCCCLKTWYFKSGQTKKKKKKKNDFFLLGAEKMYLFRLVLVAPMHIDCVKIEW